MRRNSKAYWKERAEENEKNGRELANDNIHSFNSLQESEIEASTAKRKLAEQKRTGWRKRAIMQCLVGISYNEAASLIASVQGDLGRKHGGEIITYSEQS